MNTARNSHGVSSLALSAGLLFGVVSLARAQMVDYNGLQNTPLGQAQLSSSGGRLTVSNIGSSGKDGVSIDLGETEGGLVRWEPLPPPSTLPDDTRLCFEATGTVGGFSGQPIGLVMATDTGSTIQLVADYSPIGSQTQRLEFFDGGVLELVQEGFSGPFTASRMPTACDKGGLRIPEPLPPFPPQFPGPFLPFPCFVWTWDQPVLFNVPGAGNFTADEVRILAEDGPPDIRVSFLDLKITDPSPTPGTLDILDEALELFARPHRGCGNARIQGVPSGGGPPTMKVTSHRDFLIVSNIGSSGLDGVSIDLGPNEIGAGFQWEPIDPGQPPGSGSGLQLLADATVSGVPGQPLGHVTLTGTGTGADIVADYSPVGSQTQRLEILNQGQVVHVVSGHSGPVQVPEWPGGCGKAFVRIPPVLCFFYSWDQSVPITIPGQAPVTGDELRLLSENPGFTYDTLDRLVLKAFLVPGNQITLEFEPNAIDGDPPSGWDSAQSLGEAALETGGDHLVVSNIGSSGCDGVRIDVGESLDLFRTDWAPLGTDQDHPSGLLRVRADGLLQGDSSARPLGSVSVENLLGLQLATDYSPIGATQIRVLVIDDHVTTADFVVPDGQIATLPQWPRGCGKEPVDLGGGPTLCFWIDPGDDVPVDFGGGGPRKTDGTAVVHNTDLIRLIAVDASGPLESIETWELFLRDMQFLLLTNIASEHPTDTRSAPPRVTRLHPAYPNPFNPRTTLAFDLEREGRVRLRVFSLRGRLVGTLYEGRLGAGRQRVGWNGLDADGRALSSGTYVVRLETRAGVSSQKVTLLK